MGGSEREITAKELSSLEEACVLHTLLVVKAKGLLLPLREMDQACGE